MHLHEKKLDPLSNVTIVPRTLQPYKTLLKEVNALKPYKRSACFQLCPKTTMVAKGI